jgi:UDP-N-acetylglucosamine acyltransferase
MNKIHPTAIVSPKAKLGENIQVEPFAIIYDDVEIGDDCVIGPSAAIYDGARIGNRVKIFQSAAVANLPQDLKYDNEETFFYVGDDSVIREFVTLHKGTKETGESRIGKNCLIMAYTHVAHDVQIGDNCIIANSVQIAGHITIEDWVIIGGGTLIHQFGKIGQHSMVGGGMHVNMDIPPYVITMGVPIRYAGLNIIGLRRRGFSADEIGTLKEAYKILYESGLNISQGREKLENEFIDSPHVQNIINFIKGSQRGLIRK